MDYIEENKILVQNIRDLCKSRNISLTILEETLSFANGAIGKWAKSHKRPNYDRVLAVAQHFGVSVDYLRGETDKKNPATEGGYSEQARYVANVYDKLPDYLRAIIDDTIAAYEKSAPNE